jgi:hypothetical protein
VYPVDDQWKDRFGALYDLRSLHRSGPNGGPVGNSDSNPQLCARKQGLRATDTHSSVREGP